ncbi:hypothetical protein [Methylobacterium soli]|uniref:Uncharacterized protein n=1 Tax=Methylobacterium soli TaxID=553447 RepID=A0A6L3T471_9HYPH|nr:hypothetical protein [Methylobacterium soli]KAB1081724.1 hypothetical protein F6X53_01080 [Methylobacterium soli]
MQRRNSKLVSFIAAIFSGEHKKPSSSRRNFLRSLLSSLPTLSLIGGSVALTGSSTSAAEPVTNELLDSYDAWLEHERRQLQWERYRSQPVYRLPHPFSDGRGATFDQVPLANGGAQFHATNSQQASARAALVLSAVGCEWRGKSL